MQISDKRIKPICHSFVLYGLPSILSILKEWMVFTILSISIVYMMKLDRSTLCSLLGLVIIIAIFNVFTREGFYDEVVIRGTGLSVSPITGTPKDKAKDKAKDKSKDNAKDKSKAMQKADPAAMSSAMDLQAATVTQEPTAPLTQMGSLGMKPIATQQVTDKAGIQAASRIQSKMTPTDSMSAASAPRGIVIGPTMGPSDSSMDSCDNDYDDDCDGGCNKSSYF